MKSRFPRRWLAYMAGKGLRLFLPLCEELLKRAGEQIETFTLVVGDLSGYRWVCTHAKHPRLHLIYQHEALNPFRKPTPIDQAQLNAYEARYGLPHLWRYILSHRMIDRLSYDRKLAYLHAYINYFENLAVNYQPEVFLSAAPDSLLFMAGFKVMQSNGAVPLLLGPSRFPGRAYIVDNEIEQIPGIEAAYAAIKQRSLTDQEANESQALIDAYRVKQVRPQYFGLGPRLSRFPSVSRLMDMSRRWFAEDDRYFEVDVLQLVRQSVKTRLKTPWQARELSQLSVNQFSGEPFFYYPLHYEPESTVDVFSTFWRDQVFLIRWVASALPAGYWLYVKENPNMAIGARPLGFYREIASIPGVRLCATSMNSYEIIQKSRGVVTLAGTTGLEALMLGKPVLLLGHAFYEVFREGVLRADGGQESVVQALQRMAAIERIDDGLLLRFIAASLKRSYATEFEMYKPEVEGPQNINDLADSVLEELVLRFPEAKAMV